MIKKFCFKKSNKMVKSVKSSKKNLPPHKTASPSANISPKSPSTQNSPNKSKSTKNPSGKEPTGDARMTPSFGKTDDVVPPTATTANAIVKSHKETDEELYRYLNPKKGKKMPFRQLLISNIVLTIFNLILLSVWIYLLSIFTWDNTESYIAPGEKLNDALQICRSYRQAESPNDMPDLCVYAKEKYSTNCKQISCSFVRLSIAQSNGSLFGTNQKLNVYKFKPVEKTFVVPSPEFIHCDKSSWCQSGKCEKVLEDEKRLDEYDLEPAQNGVWKSHCSVDEVQCFEKGQSSLFLTLNSYSECNEINEELTCSSKYGQYTIPNVYVKFAFRSCNNPVPMFGGKPCWKDGQDEVTNVVVATEVCGSCSSRAPLRLIPPCNRSTAVKKECTITCGSEGVIHYLPNSYNCTFADRSPGFCFHGICAPYVVHETCSHDDHHGQNHNRTIDGDDDEDHHGRDTTIRK